MKAEITIEKIEYDGTISFKTDKIPNLLHKSAEDFLEFVKKKLGGNVSIEKLKEHHVHDSEEQHEHQKLT